VIDADEAQRRWRLILGAADGGATKLAGADAAIDKALGALYDNERRGGLENSAPNVTRWLGDIRSYFPASVVRVMQQDAMERLNLKRLLLEPELLESVQPDVHLVADLISLSSAIPERTKETARLVVRKVVEEVERRLAQKLVQAVHGSLNRAARNNRPRASEIDWPRTIRANLKHYQPEYRTIVPERRIGYGRKRSALRKVIVCVDQSGSMANSVVYASIFAAVLASMRALQTSLVVFDTAVVDLTPQLADPVDILFGVRLGGGTDIAQALSYCQSLVRAPQDTILVLISDLIEGGVRENLLKRAASLIASGVQLVALLALSDEGAPAYDRDNAQSLAAMGVPAFACTPDRFPELMAAAIQRQSMTTFAAGMRE
jgi:Mg-chelatase subunit ChlD